MRRRKRNFKNSLVHSGNGARVTCVKYQSADHYTIQTLLSEQLDFDKLYYVYNKSSNFTNPSLPQIEMIDIGHKSLPIIIGPYHTWFFSLLGTIATVMGRIAMLPHVTHYNATVSTLIPIIAEGMEQPGTTWEHYFLYWHVLHLLLFHHRKKELHAKLDFIY